MTLRLIILCALICAVSDFPLAAEKVIIRDVKDKASKPLVRIDNKGRIVAGCSQPNGRRLEMAFPRIGEHFQAQQSDDFTCVLQSQGGNRYRIWCKNGGDPCTTQAYVCDGSSCGPGAAP